MSRRTRMLGRGMSVGSKRDKQLSTQRSGVARKNCSARRVAITCLLSRPGYGWVAAGWVVFYVLIVVCSPRMPSILRITHRQRRTFVSALFGLTFFASALTVSASNVLPCPVRPDRNHHADGERETRGGGSPAVVVKRPRRWIRERNVTEH